MKATKLLLLYFLFLMVYRTTNTRSEKKQSKPEKKTINRAISHSINWRCVDYYQTCDVLIFPLSRNFARISFCRYHKSSKWKKWDNKTYFMEFSINWGYKHSFNRSIWIFQPNINYAVEMNFIFKISRFFLFFFWKNSIFNKADTAGKGTRFDLKSRNQFFFILKLWMQIWVRKLVDRRIETRILY